MQIVINVDNELYEYFSKRRTMHDNGYFSHIGKLIKALRGGSLLPKGCGRLIDADELLASERPRGIADDVWKESHIYKLLSNAPTIIKADKE